MTEVDEYFHFFEVKLENLFDGPIDLLLHLVKQNELEIEKVSLARVADQYLSCIQTMQQYDLEIAGEYLVIAATLLSIKSSVFLGDPVELTLDQDGNLIDPHEELLLRLREAQVYKEGAEKLEGRDLLDVDVFATPSKLKKVKAPPMEFKDHDPILLGRAFRRLLEELGPEARYEVELESVSVVERMMGVLEALQSSNGRRGFRELVPDLTSKGQIIGTFIALLELCKRQIIRVEQENNFEGISIVLVADGYSDEIKIESEFDGLQDGTQVTANA